MASSSASTSEPAKVNKISIDSKSSPPFVKGDTVKQAKVKIHKSDCLPECFNLYFEVDPDDFMYEAPEIDYDDVDDLEEWEQRPERQIALPTIINWNKEIKSFSSDQVEVLKDNVKKIALRPSFAPIKPLSRIWIHYAGFLKDRDESFDSTRSRHTCHQVNLGQNETFEGLGIALESMKLNELSKFLIPSELAFGELGCRPRIPPNSSVVFFVEIVHAVDQEELNNFMYLNSKERAVLGFQAIFEASEDAKRNGNEQYQFKNYYRAMKWYRIGINWLEEFSVKNEAEEEERVRGLFFLYCNLATTLLKLEKPAQACNAVKNCLTNKDGARGEKIPMAKAYFRFAQAKFMLESNEEAIKHCEKALLLNQNDPEIIKLKKKIQDSINSDLLTRKLLYQNMMG